MNEFVLQRMRLNVLDCLRGIADARGHDDRIHLLLEFLIEDFTDPNTPKHRFEHAVDYVLVDVQERNRVRPLLPRLLAAYMEWEWEDPKARAYLSLDWSELQRECAAVVALMDANVFAHQIALNERRQEIA